jgi:hypothetical protein
MEPAASAAARVVAESRAAIARPQAAIAGDPGLAQRTWVLLTESPEGGWGIAGHANTGRDIAQSARAELAAKTQP